MMKKFILAATSIAYILSTATVTDAKLSKKTNQKNLYQLDCQKPINSTYKHNQSIQENASFAQDMVAVCRLILEKYTEYNALGADLQKKAESNTSGETIAEEINSIKLTHYEQYKLAKRTNIGVEIKLTRRFCLWNNNKWDISVSNRINRLVVRNTNGKLEITRDVVFDSEDRMITR
jgi:hypothetical protein